MRPRSRAPLLLALLAARCSPSSACADVWASFGGAPSYVLSITASSDSDVVASVAGLPSYWRAGEAWTLSLARCVKAARS